MEQEQTSTKKSNWTNSTRSPKKNNIKEIKNLVDNIADEMINAQQALMRMSFKLSDLELYLADIDGDDPMFDYTHVLQHIIEDILQKFAHDYTEWLHYSGMASEAPSNPVERYANEIRKLLGEQKHE